MTRRELILFMASGPLLTGNPGPKDFAEQSFQGRRVFKIAGSGPPVLFLHELPGLITEAFELARRLNDHGNGYTVYLPLFFGQPEQKGFFTDISTELFRTPCWSQDFHCFSDHSLGKAVDWAAAYCVEIDRLHNHAGLAVIGNCLTGGFPVALAARPAVAKVLRCAVASQPALPMGPFGAPLSTAGKAALGLTTDELNAAIASKIPFLALRFDNDKLVPSDRLDGLERAFKEKHGNFDYYRVPHDAHCSTSHSGHNHAVLTLGYCPDPKSGGRLAYLRLKAFLDKYLKGTDK